MIGVFTCKTAEVSNMRNSLISITNFKNFRTLKMFKNQNFKKLILNKKN